MESAMRSITSKSLHSEGRRLRSISYESYKALMQKLCRSYSHYACAVSINIYLIDNDIRGLVQYADWLSTQKYVDATHHFVANQFSLLVRKYPFPGVEKLFNPEQAAIDKFLAAEHSCKRVNQWFVTNRYCTHGVHENSFDKMRNFIRYCIGEEVPKSKIWQDVGFGPGASIGVHGNATNAFRKITSERWSVTPGALHYAYAAVKQHAQLREVLYPQHGGFSTGCNDEDFRVFMERVNLVQHNKITFVPKTCKTHRSIAIEPLLNGFVQKGIDSYMRLALKRVGIDLSDQTINQELARKGSSSWKDADSFVTIDLSSASDSISIELCRELLPHDWFHFLNANRSKFYVLNGTQREYHKFVSMGNGFCFPLETLLFTSACHAVGAGKPGYDFHVYGDDIIVRRQYAVPLLQLLKRLGFKANDDKTFIEGPFRESCGGDYFEGKDVRPFTLDYALDSVQNVFKFLNLSNRSALTQAFFEPVREYVISLIGQKYRLFRPFKGDADTGIDSVGEEFLTSPHCRFLRKKRSWAWYELCSRPVFDQAFEPDRYPAVHVYGALSGSASTGVFSLRNVTRTRMRLISHPGATSRWLPR